MIGTSFFVSSVYFETCQRMNRSNTVCIPWKKGPLINSMMCFLVKCSQFSHVTRWYWLLSAVNSSIFGFNAFVDSQVDKLVGFPFIFEFESLFKSTVGFDLTLLFGSVFHIKFYHVMFLGYAFIAFFKASGSITVAPGLFPLLTVVGTNSFPIISSYSSNSIEYSRFICSHLTVPMMA